MNILYIGILTYIQEKVNPHPPLGVDFQSADWYTTGSYTYRVAFVFPMDISAVICPEGGAKRLFYGKYENGCLSRSAQRQTIAYE